MKIYVYLGAEQFQPEQLLQQACTAETSGFDGVMVSEHFTPWVDDVGASGFTLATLAAIAVVTERLELMTGVVTPLWRYHPAVVAQAAATISRLAGGRFALGVGSGEVINEEPLGYVIGPYKERSARLSEALDIIEPLLKGERVTSDGNYYKASGAKLYSPPIGKVPVYVAAGGPKTAEMAGGQAEGIIISVKDADDALTRIIMPAKEAARAQGRSRPTIVASHWTVRAANDEEATTALKPWRGLRAPSRDKVGDPRKLQAEADAMDPAAILSRYTRVASADDYIRVYGEIAKVVQPDILVIQTTSIDQQETIKMLGRDVLPGLRS